LNYYPFHIGDYLSATRHLTWAEDAAFRRLLDVYYTTERPLPVELRAVYRLVVAGTDEQRAAVEAVLNEFFVPSAAGWVNGRADAEIEAMREKQQKQRDKANKRWHKPAAEPGNASAMPRHAATDATASAIDANAMPPTPTPTPTPVKEEESPRKRVQPIPRPDDVAEQIWDDWVQLRKGKKAAVSLTAVAEARTEADKAGLSLERFLAVWCARGSTGLQADWLKPHERGARVNGGRFTAAAAGIFDQPNHAEVIDV
jgi:uncharacterized protein YdaU (DUF1376 family)